MRGLAVWALTALALSTSAACRQRDDSVRPEAPGAETKPDRDAEILEQLRAFESTRREATDFARLPASDGAFGADPYAVLALDDEYAAAVLRGTSELLLLDGKGKTLSRAEAPPGAIALCDTGDHVLVVGERAPAVWVYERAEESWVLVRKVTLPDAFALRGIACQGDRVFVIERDGGDLLVLSLPAVLGKPGEVVLRRKPVCPLPTAVSVQRRALSVTCAISHEIVLSRIDAHDEVEVARVHNDGPFWGADLRWYGNELWLASTGVENRPLDRSIGFFGYIDSFLYVDRVSGFDGSNATVHREREVNLSELNIVTPKVVRFEPGRADEPGGAPTADEPFPHAVFVAAAGSPGALRVAIDGNAPRVLKRIDTVPGARDATRVDGAWLVANPLFDRVTRIGDGAATISQQAASSDAALRLGEALLFTQLMAPFNESEGALSRFTCETCHFEGVVDGRVHHTGRGDVRATTKPLVGLFNNRPHFSRALDPDLSRVAHAEFRVAGANSGHDPVFALSPKQFPWLGELGIGQEVSAVDARKALMAFLMRFSPPSNPRVLGRTSFSATESRGADLFASHCEACHSARTSADDATSRVERPRWESMIMSENGPIVWGSPEYQKTGVQPYVHAKGARTPSLRRLYAKVPYFTNGTAQSLEQVLDQVRLGDEFSHQGGTGQMLSEAERAALLQFLRLL